MSSGCQTLTEKKKKKKGGVKYCQIVDLKKVLDNVIAKMDMSNGFKKKKKKNITKLQNVEDNN